MNRVKLHRRIDQIMSLYYGVGVWHQGEEPTVKEVIFKICFFIYFLLFPISLIVGALESDNKDTSIFLTESTLIVTVASVKMFYITWKKKQIMELLNRICVYDIDDCEGFTNVNDKLNIFMKFICCLFVPPSLAVLCATSVVPFLGNRKLFFEIGFPLDWRNDDLAYWLAFSFHFTVVFLTVISFAFTAIIWYLMINCGLKYDILGNQIKKMGATKVIDATGRQRKNSKEQKDIFLGDLMVAIQFHLRIREEIQQMKSFLSPVFLAQLATGSLCICGSIYRLMFTASENAVEFMINPIVLSHTFFEIFMVTYFGNEIKSSSDRLAYCLFESNWIEQPQSNKKLLLIFGEILQRPDELVVAKIYSLTLHTFSRILNAAYSMLNILVQLF